MQLVSDTEACLLFPGLPADARQTVSELFMKLIEKSL